MGSENLFVKCPNCKKDLSTTAKTCVGCGHAMKKLSIIHKIGIGVLSALVVLFFIGVLAGDKENTKTNAQEVETVKNNISSPKVTVTKRTEETIIPSAQQQLVSIVSTYANKFQSAKNELQESSYRSERKHEIKQAVTSLFVKDWVGTISELSTNSEGKVILSIRVSPKVEIKTWNNALSDTIQRTMIDSASPLYKKLFDASKGLKIRFTGSFFASAIDGIEETSLTISGSMMNPEFLFKFQDIEIIE